MAGANAPSLLPTVGGLIGGPVGGGIGSIVGGLVGGGDGGSSHTYAIQEQADRVAFSQAYKQGVRANGFMGDPNARQVGKQAIPRGYYNQVGPRAPMFSVSSAVARWPNGYPTGGDGSRRNADGTVTPNPSVPPTTDDGNIRIGLPGGGDITLPAPGTGSQTYPPVTSPGNSGGSGGSGGMVLGLLALLALGMGGK